jgi:hypothetical protein
MYVRYRPSEEFYAAFIERYHPKGSTTDIPTLKMLKSRMHKLSGLMPKIFDCCVNTCIAYTGYLQSLDTCPICGSPRFNPTTKKPQNSFTYIPLIPQLRAFFAHPQTAQKMQYRHCYNDHGDTISDIFDGTRYKQLREAKVIIEGKEQPYNYFEEEHEVALGLSADGMCPFKRRKNSCWPLLLINFNLPPDERTHINNLICVGVVPGPKCPADLNSFLQPLIDELLELARGTPAVDVYQRKLFALRAHLIEVFGDIPAITKFLEFIGHNGCFPCRLCMIGSVSGATSGGGSHRYCPLHQPNGFRQDPLNLPLRTHEECLRLGLEVLQAPNDTARSNLATQSGIKGVSLLARLHSISIPASFPVDLMHMIWQNCIPQLIDLWAGDFNNLDDGLESYRIEPTVWNAISAACSGSGSLIPSAFGCKVPSFDKRGQFIAETWSNFTLLLAPSLLWRRFSHSRYYKHFVRLVKLLRSVVSFDLPRDELPMIRRGFAEWIEEYEQ